MKQSKAVAVMMAYVVITVITAVILYFNRSYTELILIEYIIAATISIVIVAIIVIYYHKLKPRQDTEDLISTINRLTTPAVIWSDNTDDITINPAFTAATGYTPEDYREGNENIIAAMEHIRARYAADAEDVHPEDDCPIICKSDNIVTIVWHTTTMNISDGSSLHLTVGLDITDTINIKHELYRYSTKLSTEKTRYALSMELSEIGIILKEPLTDSYFISAQMRAMAGIEESYVTREQILERVHPADRIIVESLHTSIRSNPSQYANIHSTEFRVISADGQYHWYLFRYKIPNSDFMPTATFGGAVMDITKEKEKDRLIEEMAYKDEVTGISNRNSFMLVGQETLDSAIELETDYWVIVLDVDEFHIINDTCGYKNGNALLCGFAEILVSMSANGVFSARIGGDNFALIVKDNGEKLLPVTIIRKIQTELSNLAVGVLSNQTLTCSAGYCRMSDGGSDFAQILDHAEFSLSTRDSIRGSIVRYDNKLHKSILAKKEVEKELSEALDNGQLSLYYQPKINLGTGDIIGVEALIRWIKPDGTIIPPIEFIPIAENSMLITKISSFVLLEACRQAKQWQDMGLPPFTISVNLSSVDFYQTDVKASITKALKATGLDAKYLEVELTESLALKDIQNAIRQMMEIKELGVSLSMDDFGTGYSSLSYIQMLPITLLKLDRSFIMYLEDDKVSREIVSAVIRIAKSKKIETIAEGIETEGQAEILKKSGCDHAQGYFFGKPMPPEQLQNYVISRIAKISQAKPE